MLGRYSELLILNVDFELKSDLLHSQLKIKIQNQRLYKNGRFEIGSILLN